VKRIERFTKQPIPVDVVVGFEPKKSAAPRAPRAGGWKPGDGRNAGANKPGQRSFSKPAAPRREGSGGGYKGSHPRSADGARRTFGDY
jgi:hypothetical protein